MVADVQRIRSNPLVPSSIPIHWYIYDVKTGQLTEVPEATKAGEASRKVLTGIPKMTPANRRQRTPIVMPMSAIGGSHLGNLGLFRA